MNAHMLFYLDPWKRSNRKFLKARHFAGTMGMKTLWHDGIKDAVVPAETIILLSTYSPHWFHVKMAGRAMYRVQLK